MHTSSVYREGYLSSASTDYTIHGRSNSIEECSDLIYAQLPMLDSPLRTTLLDRNTSPTNNNTTRTQAEVEHKEREYRERYGGSPTNTITNTHLHTNTTTTNANIAPSAQHNQPTYCLPPQTTQTTHNTHITQTPDKLTNNNHLSETPEMLGPPIDSAYNVTHNVANQLSPNTPVMGPGAPMRRLRSVVGSPHYIAPEIASNGENMLYR